MIKKIVCQVGFLLLPFFYLNAQVALNPTISPTLFHSNDPITVTYDVTGTPLASLTAAWVWVWMPGISGSGTNATSNFNPANNNTSLTNKAKCTKTVTSGKTLFVITFVPSSFFTADISTQTKMGILLKGNDWGNGQTSDYVTNLLVGSNFQTKLSSPAQQPLFGLNGDSIIVQASASASSKFVLVINNKKLDSLSSALNYKHKIIISDSVKSYQAYVIVYSSSEIDSLSFNFLIRQSSPSLARPQGIIDGINYNSGDQTKATLCFWVPGKTSVYAFGDFTNWDINPQYLMNKDGEHFWVEIDGLTPGTEYAFQYLVNDTLRIADPYADKILETDDNKIPSTTYPNLKTIPAKAISSQWYFNHFSVLQTGQLPYQWQTSNYQKPAKEKLVIYELLIRDFFDSNNRTFQSLIDTISYFKKLGINAVELMPVAEFNGQIGWGYNPTSMFAVEKYYGHKNKLKEFVDKCHANGIAVIMDLVMNHQDLPNSYAMLDFDFVKNQPKATNKWFNPVAPHPYSVLNDLNHDSPYTRKYLDTINYYWIHEFKIDGYRYDLSKGFTQTVSTEATVSNYDASRVYNLERMADKLWQNFPDAYVILEHFASNSEETELANYRANEGKGMMLWANFNYAYNQNTMGYVTDSDVSWMYYGNRGWTAPRAVGYMESHDEERLMYKNLQYGNESGSYSVKTLSTALQRMQAAAVLFYIIPGPKMLWEFGELGYDQSINRCVNGSVNGCRLDPKPVLWSYRQDYFRDRLWNHVSDLIKLRQNYDVFSSSGTAQITGGSSTLIQQITLKNNPYTSAPIDSTQMNALMVANFELVNEPLTITFPHSGTWYDYYNAGAPVNVVSNSLSVSLDPGNFKLYTDVKIKTPSLVTAIKDNHAVEFLFYPNPVHSQLHVESEGQIENIQVRTLTGDVVIPIRTDENTWDVSSLSPGIYILEIKSDEGIVRKKIIKN